MKKLFFSLTLLFGLLTINMNAQSTRTIYLDATLWAAEAPVFMVHVWNEGDVDAADYTFEAVANTDNIYSADIRDDAAHAIFVRKDPNGNLSVIWDDAWNRAYSNIPADKDLFTVTAWEGGDEQNPCVGVWSVYGVTPEVNDAVIKVHKLDSWNSMSIWAWNSADATFMEQFVTWPGVAMEDLGDGWYGFTVKVDADIIVNNGEGNEQSQAFNVSEDACLEVSTAKNDDGHYIINAVECPDKSSAIEAVVAGDSKKAVKCIQDGQIILIRDGKIYNALGTQIK